MSNLFIHRLAPTFEQNSKYHSIIEQCGGQILLATYVGEVIIAINMGIAHVDGNLTIAGNPKYPTLFRIRAQWCDGYVVEDTTKHLKIDWGEEGEIQLDFDELVDFIDTCRGIDYPSTFNLWAKSTNKSFVSF